MGWLVLGEWCYVVGLSSSGENTGNMRAFSRSYIILDSPQGEISCPWK